MAFLARLISLTECREIHYWLASILIPRVYITYSPPPIDSVSLLPSRLRTLSLNFLVPLTEPKSINPSHPTLSASIRPAKY